MASKPSYEKLEKRILELEETQANLIAAAAQNKTHMANNLYTIFHSVNDAIWFLDPHQRIVLCNKISEQMFQCKEGDIVGKFYWEILHNTREPSPEFPAQRAVLSHKRETMEIQKDRRWFFITVDPIIAENGDNNGAIHIIRDITGQKILEEQLLESEKKYRYLFENGSDLLCIHDLKGNLLETNLAYKKQYGLSNEGLRGLNIRDFVPEKFKTDFDQYLGRIVENGEDEGLLIVLDNFGNEVILEYKNKLFYNSNGEPEAVQGSARDVTSRLKAEKDRRLMEERLHQSQRLESIGQLAGGVAHDYNNMLSVILGYSQDLLENLHAEDPIYDSINEIAEAGKRSADLTRQLLAFSRQQSLQPQVVDLNQIVSDQKKMLHRLIGEDIELITLLSDNLESVKFDPTQIIQVILNLASNARDAMPKGGKLTIQTENVELDSTYRKNHVGVAPGNFVMLSISDTGFGMDKKMQDRIFEPFFTTKAKDKGTGLGLSTVYGIIKQSGGNIWVYSEPGKGTTFKIYLKPTSDLMPDKMSASEKTSINGENNRILVVEDEASLRKLCTNMLASLNYDVRGVPNGGEALFLIEEKGYRPDLVLTDVVMPGMSGKELADRLHKELPNLKILYMSGYSADAIANHGVLDPETPYIQKPFSKEKLGVLVKRIIDADTFQGQSSAADDASDDKNR